MFTIVYYVFGARRETTRPSLKESLEFAAYGSVNETYVVMEIFTADRSTLLDAAAIAKAAGQYEDGLYNPDIDRDDRA